MKAAGSEFLDLSEAPRVVPLEGKVAKSQAGSCRLADEELAEFSVAQDDAFGFRKDGLQIGGDGVVLEGSAAGEEGNGRIGKEPIR